MGDVKWCLHAEIPTSLHWTILPRCIMNKHNNAASIHSVRINKWFHINHKTDAQITHSLRAPYGNLKYYFKYSETAQLTYIIHTYIQSVHGSVKVKQFLYRPGQVLEFPGSWSSRISRHWARDGGKVSRTHQLPLPPRKYSWYSFMLEAELTPGPECGRKD